MTLRLRKRPSAASASRRSSAACLASRFCRALTRPLGLAAAWLVISSSVYALRRSDGSRVVSTRRQKCSVSSTMFFSRLKARVEHVITGRPADLDAIVGGDALLADGVVFQRSTCSGPNMPGGP